MSRLFEEIERRVPNNTIQLFLPNHSLDQAYSFLKLRPVTSYVLNEIYIVSLEIHPWH